MKKLLKLMLGLVLAVSLVGCGESETADELVVGVGADAVSFDPHASNDQPSSRVRTNIYEGLVEQDENLEVQPLLAKEWEVDGTVWTFTLEEGVKFHNGDEVKASDFEFTLNRAMESAEVAHLLKTVESVEATDDYTLVITTSDVDLGLLPALAHPTMGVLNQKVVEEQGDKYAVGYDGNDPIGTAPFKFVSFQKGETKLARFDDYWNDDKKPSFENLLFKTYTDNSARKLAVEAGDIDIAYDIQNSDFDSIDSNSDLSYVKDYDLSYAYAGFNVEKEIFKDVRVREAINLGIDYDSIISAPTIMNGLATRANTPLSSKARGHNDDVAAYEYNPEKAKELLAEAGVTDLKFTISTNENPTRVAIATAIQAQLKEIDVTVEISQMEWGAYLDATSKGEHDVFILGWTAVTGDPEYGLSPLFHTDNIGGAGNRTFYSNPEVDALLDKAAVADNEEDRFEIYDEVQQAIMDDYVHIPFHYTERIAAMRTNISGFVLHPAGSYKLHTVEKE